MPSHYREFTTTPKHDCAREIAMSPTLCDALKHWRHKEATNSELVFPSSTGSHLSYHNLLHRFLKPALRASGLPENLGWHAFRHTSATSLKNAVVAPNVAQELLGHQDIETTLAIYTHVEADEHRAAVKALDRYLFPIVPKTRLRALRAG